MTTYSSLPLESTGSTHNQSPHSTIEHRTSKIPLSRSLTPRQNEIYEFIREAISGQGRPPTIPEIAEHFRLRSTNGVHEHLVALEAKGYIRREAKKARGIALTDRGPVGSDGGGRKIPIVGEGNSANPYSIFMTPRGMFSPDPDSMPTENAFAAIVPDDGMDREGIFKGDLAVVAQSQKPTDGTLVYALLENRAVVRRFEQSGPRPYLVAANRRYDKIAVLDGSPDQAILGVVTTVIRKVTPS